MSTAGLNQPPSPPLSSSPARAQAAGLTPALAAGVLLALGFVALYYRWLIVQGRHSWDKPDDWGHAFVVPLISIYMLWRVRDQLRSTPIKPFWPGLLPLVLGVACYFFFVVSVALSNHMLQGAAMVLCLAGVCLVAFGLGVFRLAFLPIAYLLMGITISEQVMIKVTFQLQLLATQGSWLLLKLISLPGSWFMVQAEGNLLEVFHDGRRIPLNVAEACSGMRMVIAFVALAGAVAIFSTKLWWQRIAVVALSVPVALFMNIIRVAVLALLSLSNPELATGNIHMVIGTLLLVPGLFLFLGVVWILQRIVREEPASPSAPAPAKPTA